MPARTDRENNRRPSDERRYEADVDEQFQQHGFEQSKNLTSGRQESRSRGGGHSRISPSGGEYLRGAPREYPSDEFSEQGFGRKVHDRTGWRVEDRIFGPDSVVNEAIPNQQYRGVGPRGYRRADDRIREDACEALSDDDRIDASNIDVSVSEGEITLNGTVGSRADKRRAEDVVEAVRGVKDVHNRLRIQES